MILVNLQALSSEKNRHRICLVTTRTNLIQPMTIYGNKAAKLRVEPIANRCDNCNTVHTMDMHVFQKYKSVLGVPFFPVSKTGVALCAHCRKRLRQKDMPVTLLKSYNQVKSHTQIPLWTWTGAALILLSIIIFIVLR